MIRQKFNDSKTKQTTEFRLKDLVPKTLLPRAQNRKPNRTNE